MTHDDHQRERMRHWSQVHSHAYDRVGQDEIADNSLAEFDKRFPAPSAAAPVSPIVDRSNLADTITVRQDHYTALEDKARLWDAVASGKLGIYPRDGDFAVHWDIGYSIRPTAAEAVESAIAQGAFK